MPLVLGRIVSIPPKIPMSPVKYFFKSGSPPCVSPDIPFLTSNLLSIFFNGLLILLPASPPKPNPRVKSKFLINFDKVMNSAPNISVPAKSLNPIAT